MSDERVMSMKDVVFDKINDLMATMNTFPASRELSTAKTKLDEARLWFSEVKSEAPDVPDYYAVEQN